jgi:hypothetical protein
MRAFLIGFFAGDLFPATRDEWAAVGAGLAIACVLAVSGVSCAVLAVQ